MPNANKIMDDLNFDNAIEKFTPVEKFLARQIREIQKLCAARENCPVYPNFRLSRKQVAWGVGGLTGYTAIIVAIAEALGRLFG